MCRYPARRAHSSPHQNSSESVLKVSETPLSLHLLEYKSAIEGGPSIVRVSFPRPALSYAYTYVPLRIQWCIKYTYRSIHYSKDTLYRQGRYAASTEALPIVINLSARR